MKRPAKIDPKFITALRDAQSASLLNTLDIAGQGHKARRVLPDERSG